MDAAKIQSDFDEIACLGEASGTAWYDRFLLSLVPADAARILDVGCGFGRLTTAVARDDREVLGVDLSPGMIERARRSPRTQVSFLCGDFLQLDFGAQSFDCIISAATLHHVPDDAAVARMAALLRPGGRLIVHDIRRDDGLADIARSGVALAHLALGRLVRTGRLRKPRKVRQVWERHGAGETYLSVREARALATRLLPGARVFDHWLWRYTIVWDKV